MNDHGLEQLVHFPTQEKNIGFNTHFSPWSVSGYPLPDHDIVSGTLNVINPPIKKPRRKAYLYQKGDFEPMRKDAFEFAKEKYFNSHSDTR